MNGVTDFVGFSELGIHEAVQNALKKAGEPSHFEVVETLSSQNTKTKRLYEVRIKTHID